MEPVAKAERYVDEGDDDNDDDVHEDDNGDRVNNPLAEFPGLSGLKL